MMAVSRKDCTHPDGKIRHNPTNGAIQCFECGEVFISATEVDEERAEALGDDVADLQVTAGVSHKTKLGFVQVEARRRVGQLSPAQARVYALHILECAEAAEADATANRFARERLGLDEHRAAHFLNDFRTFRRQLEETRATAQKGVS